MRFINTAAHSVPTMIYGIRRPMRVLVRSESAPKKGRRNSANTLSNAMMAPEIVSLIWNDSLRIKGMIESYTCQNAQMEKKAKKTGEKPVMTNFAVYNLARNNRFDYSKAERELGYHTRPYEETLRDEAKWLMEEGFCAFA